MIAALASAVIATGALAAPITTEIVSTDDGWRLLRGGAAYVIRGAGGREHLEQIVACGGNSIRTWGQDQIEPRDDGTGRLVSLLDRAHELGLSVCVGYWVEHPRHGFDYADASAVDAQIRDAVAFVRTWKDHPAVLMWGVGNEVGLTGDHERLYAEVNRIARAIKEEDPDHPTMMAISGVWPDKAAVFARRCPDIDILGINVYGGLNAVPQELTRQGYDGPYIVTEFGPLGHWEVAQTSWGAAVEQTSASKALTFRVKYEAGVADQADRCLGSYAFLWGNKQEQTETWYGMFLATGEKLASVDMMSKLWTGNWPENRAPDVDGIECGAAMRSVRGGVEFEAKVLASDHEGDELQIRWVVRPESVDKKTGGDAEAAPTDLAGLFVWQSDTRVRFRTPEAPGAYRLFVYVYDGSGGAGTANVPFRVVESKEAER